MDVTALVVAIIGATTGVVGVLTAVISIRVKTTGTVPPSAFVGPVR
jgi:hypothetical protein